MARHNIRQLPETPPPRPRKGLLTIRPLSPSKIGKQVVSHRARSLLASIPTSSSESRSYSPLTNLMGSDDAVPTGGEPPTRCTEPYKPVTMIHLKPYSSSVENFFKAAVDAAIERHSNSPNEVEQFFQDSVDTRRASLDVDRILESMAYDKGSRLKELHDSDGEPLQYDGGCEACKAKARRFEAKTEESWTSGEVSVRPKSTGS